MVSMLGFTPPRQEDQKLRLGSYVDTGPHTAGTTTKSPATATTKTTIAKVSPRLLKSATRGLSSQKMNVPRKIEPQAQVIYSYLDQENHTDRDGVRVTTTGQRQRLWSSRR